jgi:methylmalonyl-CoA/ethylmalonyl-CoA epimerase
MRFDHVSIAVRSIDRALEFFQKHFPIAIREPKTFEEQVSGSFYFQSIHLGGFAIELIEDPPGQPGFVGKFIEKHGEGMHHLSIEVNYLAPIIAALKADGHRIVDEMSMPSGSATAFISPRAAFGTLIQFWQVPDFDKPHPKPAPDGLAYFDHVSIAVRDIKAAYDFFGRYLGGKAGRDPHVSNSEGNFAIGNMDIAGFKLEFISSAPHQVENDFVARFIARYGEGMHHISLDIKDFDGMRDRLKADGIRVVDEKRNWRGERQFFISPSSAFGVLIQVWDGLK